MENSTLNIPVIEARNLKIYFNSGNLFHIRKYIINDFNIKINSGEIIGLCGESGTGKTTIGKTLLNLHNGWDGKIFWNGNDIKGTDIRFIRHQYNWIGQEPSLTFNPVKKINSVILETLSLHFGSTKAEIEEKVLSMCDKFKIEHFLLDRYPAELSAGQIQRLALIRILLLKPKFIVFDEPTSSLDPINTRIFIENIVEYKSINDLSILFISHSENLLDSICNHIINLGD
jgi:peptide/nickel transport system ATP-binding protein